MNPRLIAVATLTCAWLAGCSQPPSKLTIESQTLLKTTASWDGTPYTTYPRGTPELTLIKLYIPAHTVLDWHTHPIPNAAYMLSGELTVETRKQGHKRTLKEGDALAETVGILHRGTTGAQPAVLLVFYAGVPMLPLSEKPK
ncbi:cupin domain-containing protein [Pseudomonas turukhanskensis]|uniref:Cupin type-2 domain-containing protein n=1 Tax=Pseudomonas turukhanskensis TaxID=1806536 RepID=A0A9W6K5L2_9PSED|nr:cupin domain-containing protein [Pseudomonas turukhanskensis]GLK89896.1 hypothetical protein GCM10017655_29580 [Pseudomonas turukhanskensis]